MDQILIAQLASTAFLAGLIWIVQILHYPAFARIRDEEFRAFHSHHTNRISFLVAPLMIVELVTAGALAWLMQDLFFAVNFTLAILVWILTFTLSVPIHNSLAETRQDTTIQRLVLTNWPRTIVWTVKWLSLSIWCAQNLKVRM